MDNLSIFFEAGTYISVFLIFSSIVYTLYSAIRTINNTLVEIKKSLPSREEQMIQKGRKYYLKYKTLQEKANNRQLNTDWSDWMSEGELNI